MIVIGLTGFRGAGKDTVANYFMKQHGFIKMSFAAVLKDIVSVLFSYSREMLEGNTPEHRHEREQIDSFWSEKLNIPNVTPLKLLQCVGTECLRNVLGKDLFVHILDCAIQKRINDITNDQNKLNLRIIVTDCRFPNEFEMLRTNYNTIIVEILREPHQEWVQQYINQKDEKSKTNILKQYKIDLHSSELEWLSIEKQYSLFNFTDLSVLYHQCDELFEKL